MSKIKWDQTGEKFYETGVKEGILFPRAVDGTYPKGVAWNGLISVTESPSGAEATPLYADDIKYLNLISTEEFGGTIEAYYFPDEFAECDGSSELANGVSVGQQKRTTFGLAYKTTLGNDIENNEYGYKLHLIYGALASPSETNYTTINDSPEAITFSWPFTTTPVAVAKIGDKTFKPTSRIIIDSTKADEDNLAALLEILQGKDPTTEGGTDGVEPRLPLPDEVARIMSAVTEDEEDETP